MDDALVIAMVRKGNVDAFTEVVERYKLAITSYLYRLTGDFEVARDLTQDTFIQALKSLMETETDILLRAWLYGIATNKALQYKRRKRILSFIPLEKYMKKELLDGNYQNDHFDEKTAVETTLLKIPEKERVCILLHFVEDFKYREIALTLGISEDAVRMRVARGSEKFRKVYNERGVGKEL